MAHYDSGIRYGSGARYDEPATPQIPTHSSTMIRLTRFLQNPFDARQISLDELLAFATDHLQRLIANNPGALYNTRITATNTALATVESCVSDDQTKLGLRKARKLAKDAFRTALPANIAKIHAVTVAKYGPNAPEILEFFPQGRSVFNTSTDDHLQNHLTALHTALTARVAEVGSQVVSDAAGLLSTWIALYAASESSTASKTTTEEGKANARLGLQLELFLNLLEIAKNNPRNPDALPLFMQQHFLEDPASPEEDEEEPPPTPPGP